MFVILMLGLFWGRVECGGVPRLDGALNILWQSPTGRCMTKYNLNFRLVNFNFDFNARDRYLGHSNAIFYHFGKFPHRDIYTEEIVNGGVPQAGNMTLHLVDGIRDIEHRAALPICDSEDGTCTGTEVCEGSEWVCVEVENQDWNQPLIVVREGKSCTVDDPTSALHGSHVCGYKHLSGCVPVDKSRCGQIDRSYECYGTFNMEWWRPDWDTNWSPDLKFYRTMSEDLAAKEMYPNENRPLNDTMKDHVTDEAKKQFEKWAGEYIVRSFELAQNLRPNCKWGYYAYPYCFNSADPMSYSCKSTTEGRNDKLDYFWEAADCLQPSVYMYHHFNRTEAFRFHYAAYCEAIRTGMAVHRKNGYPWPPVLEDYTTGDNNFPDDYWKCIVPYVTYKHDLIPEPDLYKCDDVKLTIRMGAYFGFEAMYVWGSSYDVIDYVNATTGEVYNVLCPLIMNHTLSCIGPYAKKVIQWANQCSSIKCSGNGRCAHYGTLCNGNAKVAELESLDLDEFVTDPVKLKADYFCKCKPGWKGRECELTK